MSLHQIIYTSCMRGINGVNDGQQVFSHDAAFRDVNNDEIKSLFSYQPPALDPGVIMTEEIATTLPRSFVYRRLENGNCTLTLSTYLGRDYMGSAGRFGNHLSHVIVADEDDMKQYPCEFYGSSVLRDHMKFEEVNNPNRPDFLPTPVLERGFTVDVDTVIDFLSVGDRIEIFKNMLHAVLAFESERKRVVICDDPENIIMWIAAIHYSLPLRTALNINFSTYDFDPSLSASQICGVIPKGSRYTAESQRLHFVFDLYENHCVEFEKDGHYFEFIDTAMSFSYDSLQDFHRFITEGYTYNQANEQMYAAYRLYSLLSDGIEGLSESEIKTALAFATEYALPQEKVRVVQNLLEQKDCLLQIGISSFLCVMQYAVENYETLSEEYHSIVKAIMVDRVLYEFLNSASGEAAFSTFYNKVDVVCRESGFSIATELMRKNNCQKLFTVMKNDIATWKIAFIVKVISTFIKDRKVSVNELMIEEPLGQMYFGLVQAVYSRNAQNGFFLVSRILDEFAEDCNYLVNMALNVEGMLFDLPNANREIASMWKYFGQLMIQQQKNDFAIAYSVLDSYQRYEQIYMLYSLALLNAKGVAENQKIFNEHYDTFIVRNRDYAKQYTLQIFNDYYKKLQTYGPDASYGAKVELFEMIVPANLEVAFAEDLVEDIVKAIPLESPKKEDRQVIQTAFDYIYNHMRKPVPSKLLLLVVGMVFEKCKKTSQLHDAFDKLKQLTARQKLDMSRLTERAAEKYFEWVLPNTCELCVCTEDMEELYDLFDMPSHISNQFFEFCTEFYLKQSKADKDYGIFCEFLGLVFEKGNPKVREEIGKTLSKFNKQKRADLDETVLDIYHENRSYLRRWSEIKEIADATNPILNNIVNLFKKKKD